MTFDITRLVVVCMRCPANATVLLAEFEAFTDGLLIWCECHGEHVLGRMYGLDVRHEWKNYRNGETVRINMDAIDRFSREGATRARAEAARAMEMAGKRITAFDSFLAAQDEPEHKT